MELKLYIFYFNYLSYLMKEFRHIFRNAQVWIHKLFINYESKFNIT